MAGLPHLRGFESLDVFDAIDDAPTELDVTRALASPAPPFERARRNAPARSDFFLREVFDEHRHVLPSNVKTCGKSGTGQGRRKVGER